MVVSVDKYTTVKMYDKVQHYWAIEKQKIMQERNSAATKEQRDELTRILNYMNRVEWRSSSLRKPMRMRSSRSRARHFHAPAEDERCHAGRPGY